MMPRAWKCQVFQRVSMRNRQLWWFVGFFLFGFLTVNSFLLKFYLLPHFTSSDVIPNHKYMHEIKYKRNVETRPKKNNSLWYCSAHVLWLFKSSGWCQLTLISSPQLRISFGSQRQVSSANIDETGDGHGCVLQSECIDGLFDLHILELTVFELILQVTSLDTV